MNCRSMTVSSKPRETTPSTKPDWPLCVFIWTASDSYGSMAWQISVDHCPFWPSSGFSTTGRSFPIIQSEELVDTFEAVSLPEARQLLRFELNYNDEDERVEVLARTRPFRTVARNANERAIADYLDRIAPGATGEMSRVLGEFQTLQGNQFGEAFAGMSPASYGASTGAALNTARLNSQVVSNRMQSLWSGAATRQAEASSSRLDGILLAYNGPNASLGKFAGPSSTGGFPAALGGLGQCLWPMDDPGCRRRICGLRQRYLRGGPRNGLRSFRNLAGGSELRLFQQ